MVSADVGALGSSRALSAAGACVASAAELSRRRSDRSTNASRFRGFGGALNQTANGISE